MIAQAAPDRRRQQGAQDADVAGPRPTSSGFPTMTSVATVATLTSLFATTFSDRAYYAFFGSLLFLAIVVPATAHWRVGLTAWHVVVLTAIPLVAVRAIYQVVYEDRFDVDRAFVWPADLSDAVPAALEISIGTALLGFGFFHTAKMRSTVRWEVNWGGDRQIAKRLSLLLGVLVVASFTVFIRQTGGLSLEDISSKRTLADADVSSLARVMALPAGFGIWSLLLYLEYLGPRKIVGRPSRTIAVSILVLISIVPAIYVSSRSQLIAVAISAFAMRYYKTGVVRLKPILAILVLLLLCLSLIFQIRTARKNQLDRFETSPAEMVGSLVINRNYADVSKHFNLTEAVDGDRYDNELGNTYTGLALVWIPRSAWPGKPAVSPGPRFQEVAYGEDTRGGIPPGGVTELRWNFGLIGMLLLVYPVGMLLGRVDSWFRGALRGGDVFYCGLGLLVVSQFLGESLVQSALSVILSAALLGIPLFLSGARVRRCDTVRSG